MVFTKHELTNALLKIKGVKFVIIDDDDGVPGKVLITIRYKFWTTLFPWLYRRSQKKVHDFIFNNKPFNCIMVIKE